MTEIKRRNGYYFYKGMQLPSVSTILKSAGNSEGLIHWACRQGGLGVIWGLSQVKDHQKLKEKLQSPSCVEWAIEQAKKGLASEGDRVKDFGTRVHYGIESRLNHKDIDIMGWSEDEKTALKTFEEFYSAVGFDPISVETSVYSPQYGYAGRLDLVAEVNEQQADAIRPYLTRSSDDIKPGLLMSDFKTGSMYYKSQAVQLSAYKQAYLETYKRQCTGGLIINIAREEPDRVKCHYFSAGTLENAFTQGLLPARQAWLYFDAPQWFFKQEQQHLKAVGE